ncbi:MAG: hypothetical protein H2172_14255 [Opitutus sp.]|nr:hypothetical protein [Opitutus sp.]MCS6246271.1 hypothetical protein [Opitutus sp.]MCS6273855.1 hypothetical protein [Opitutus sp.]MCS6277558.1 hypothetical protein [Opitutus sp.]MCS6300676.1 hypothetical protein [Opitutus sp.]
MSQLTTTLKQLKLSGLGRTLDLRLQEAAASRLSHLEFLELIFQDEINLREQKRLESRTRVAEFKSLKTLEDFDWRFNPSVSRKDIYELAANSPPRSSWPRRGCVSPTSAAADPHRSMRSSPAAYQKPSSRSGKEIFRWRNLSRHSLMSATPAR